MGLTIVKQLVENQAGTLAVTSTVEKGSNFSFVLSFKKTGLSTTEERDSEITPTIKNLKILVVEDVKLNQLLIIRIILEDFGIEVDLADNGMNDFISKPIDEKLLYMKIVEYLPNPNF